MSRTNIKYLFLINKNIISIGISTNLLNIMGAFIPSLMGIYLMYSESNKEGFLKFLKKGIEYKFEIKYYLYLFILIIPRPIIIFGLSLSKISTLCSVIGLLLLFFIFIICFLDHFG